MTTGGLPVVAWQQNGTGAAFDVFALVGLTGSAGNLSGAGKTISAASATDTRSASYPASLFPSVAALPGGGAAVAWQDDRYDPDPLFTGHNTDTGSGSVTTSTTDPDAWEPMVATLTAPGGSWGAPVRVAPNPALAQRHPTLIARPDGALVIVWDAKTSTSSSGADPKLNWSASHDNGATWETAKGLDDQAVGTSQRPRLGLDPGGQVRVVWHDSRAADWRWRVRTAVLDDGAGWVEAHDLSVAGSSMFPATSAGYVTWTTDRGAAPQRDLTQQVVLAAPAPAAAAALPEAPLAVAVPLVAAVAGAAVLARSRSGVAAAAGHEQRGTGCGGNQDEFDRG